MSVPATPHPDWIIPAWPADIAHAGVNALVTTRAGGDSVGPLASFNVRSNSLEPAGTTVANLARLRACLPSDPVWLKQVHGVEVWDADSPLPHADGPPVADASVTAKPNLVLAIQTADCLPVLFADGHGGVLGAAHAGWRGLAAGVLEATITAMIAKGAQPSRIHAYTGPAISQAAFEVGEDVRDAFCTPSIEAAAAFLPHPITPGKWYADLFMLAGQRLARVGVHHVSGGQHCTHSQPARFFSYRRDKPTGHMASLIWRAA